MARIPNPTWAYPSAEANAAPGGLLIQAPVVPEPPDVVVAAAPPAAKSKGKTK